MHKVIVLGSLNMDLSIESDRVPVAGETLKGFNFLASPGGKGANQAVAAAKLGSSVHMVGAVGNDVFGASLVQNLKTTKINTQGILKRNDVSTGVAVIVLAQKDNRIILNGGANDTVTEKEALTTLSKVGKPGDYVVCQFEIPLNTVMEGLAFAKSKGLMTILNPAPAIKVGDLSFLQHVDYLVLNEHEAETLSGLPCVKSAYKDIIEFFQNHGAKHVILTLGKDGSVTLINNQIYLQSAYLVDVVDTTGAGDAYIGGLVTGLVEGKTLEEIMKLGAQAATLKITKRGAQAAMPTRLDVKNYFKND